MKVTLCDKCMEIIPNNQGLSIESIITSRCVANKHVKRDYCDKCAKLFCNTINIDNKNLDDIRVAEPTNL